MQGCRQRSASNYISLQENSRCLPSHFERFLNSSSVLFWIDTACVPPSAHDIAMLTENNLVLYRTLTPCYPCTPCCLCQSNFHCLPCLPTAMPKKSDLDRRRLRYLRGAAVELCGYDGERSLQRMRGHLQERPPNASGELEAQVRCVCWLVRVWL